MRSHHGLHGKRLLMMFSEGSLCVPGANRDLGNDYNDYNHSSNPSRRQLTVEGQPSTTTANNRTAEQRFVLCSVSKRGPTVLVVSSLPLSVWFVYQCRVALTVILQHSETGRKCDPVETQDLYII